MASPPSVTLPWSGFSKPAMMRSVVVLPDPDGPSSVKNSPAVTWRSTLSTATTSPYVFLIPATATSAAKAALEDVESFLEIVVGDRERHEDPDHVAVETAGEEHEPAFARRGGDSRRLVAVSLGQLECQHWPEASHLGARRRHRLEPLAHADTDLLCARPRLLEGVEDRGGRCTREWVAAERTAKAAGRHRVHDLGAPRDARERQAAAKRLARDEEVRLDVVVLDRPDRPGAAAARLDLVVDVEDAVRVE